MIFLTSYGFRPRHQQTDLGEIDEAFEVFADEIQEHQEVEFDQDLEAFEVMANQAWQERQQSIHSRIFVALRNFVHRVLRRLWSN